MKIELDIADREIFFSGQVKQENMKEIASKITEINESDRINEKLMKVYGLTYTPEPIKLYIDSYGGAVYQCFGLLGHMENSITPVHTIATGAAMSCGFMILINGHRRFAFKNATPLYHQVSTGFFGKVEDMEIDVKETKRLQRELEKMTLKKTKITKTILKANREKKIDWFMTADEALKLGVVDEII
jgi:ATP-dependent Clp protease protease subunit|tara:strand:- start:27344 stop:27904 length:561 start_codon:yes stop_codon:yes gene_type:complete